MHLEDIEMHNADWIYLARIDTRMGSCEHVNELRVL
jgi:hypothetical protein